MRPFNTRDVDLDRATCGVAVRYLVGHGGHPLWYPHRAPLAAIALSQRGEPRFHMRGINRFETLRVADKGITCSKTHHITAEDTH